MTDALMIVACALGFIIVAPLIVIPAVEWFMFCAGEYDEWQHRRFMAKLKKIEIEAGKHD